MYIKTLEKIMTWYEAMQYLDKHPHMRLLTLDEALTLSIKDVIFVDGEPTQLDEFVKYAPSNAGGTNVLLKLPIKLTRR